jgi:alpha-D-xyloside xylohydrolase
MIATLGSQYDNYTMRRRSFLSLAAAPGVLAPALSGAVVTHPPQEVQPGVWKFTLGAPEQITPVSARHYPPAAEGLHKLADVKACPVAPEGSQSKRGYLVRLPLASGEIVYGLGLQLQSFIQRGLKRS